MYDMWVQKGSYTADTVLLPVTVLSLPVELLGVGVSVCILTLSGVSYGCVNMFKLMNIQVLTCPYTSLTGLIIHGVETQTC